MDSGKKILVVDDEQPTMKIGLVGTGLAGMHIAPTPVNTDVLLADTKRRIIVVGDADTFQTTAALETIAKMKEQGTVIEMISPEQAKEKYNVTFNDSLQPQNTLLIKNYRMDDDLMPKAMEYERYADDIKPSYTNLLPTKQKKRRNVGTYNEYVRKPKPKKTHRKRRK